jgi:hypothetical protein
MTAAASWFHCSVKPISRSAGRSVVAAAAYRLGARLEDHEYGELRDFTRRSGVVTSFTLAPEHAPAWARDPEALWNAAEAAENRRNSQLARECELALPAALPAAERAAIVRTLAQDLVDRYGVAITSAIHAPSRHGDDRNHHAHILMTTREVTPEGLGKKTRILDAKATGPGEVRWMREHAADLINAGLERAGLDERVDHRSFADRGITRDPTTHLGPTATEMERRGKGSERGQANYAIVAGNERFHELVGELAALDAEIAAEQERELDARYGPAAPEPEAPAADPVTAAAQVRAAAAQFAIAELAFGPTDTQRAPATVHPRTLPGFTAPADARIAAEQVQAIALLFVVAIDHAGQLPEILVNLVEDGLGWFQRAANYLSELAEEVRDTVLTWTDYARAEREERDRDHDELDFD